ncbi:MAG: hypothetical protein HY062_08385 [Bacteroidetes bacterium]|nr:hypothetical protein [Bacteroidota bacterium]
MNSIAHIINPFMAAKNSDLYSAQPITFESMRRAKSKAKGIVEVELLSAQFSADRELVPPDFTKTKNLEGSVLDVQQFDQTLKLPFIADILNRLYTESNAEFLIYTNVDIGLYEDFYIQVNHFINSGLDAFIINRRRLKNTYTQISQLPDIYTNKGKSHPGFDCFVFHRSLYPKLKLDGICIGVPFVEISFSQNLFALSSHFKLFDKEYLTFHIGEEIFKKRASKQYYKYNQKQFWKIAEQLMPVMDTKKVPYSHHILPVRLIKWGLHPCFPIRLMLKLELKRLKLL